MVHALPSLGAAAGTDLPERHVPVKLALCAVGLAGIHLATRLLDRVCVTQLCDLTQQLFDMNGEGNLPAWFTVACWFLAGILAYLVAEAEAAPRQRGGWYGVMALCLFISFDEMTMFHETFGRLLGASIGEATGADTVMLYEWLVYGVIFVGVAGLLFLPFLGRLPRSTRRRILLAGAVFLSGAFSIEYLGAASQAEIISLVRGRVWALAIALEETLEMLGVILLIHALLHHLSRSGGRKRPL